MPDPLLYGKAIGAAALVSAMLVLLMLLLRRVVGRTGWAVNPTWLNIVCVGAIGGGLAAGYYVLSLQLAWPPVSGLDRLLTIVVPAALGIELIAGIQQAPRWLAWLLRCCLVATIPRILLHGSVYLSGAGDWTAWHAYAAMVFCSALLAVVWSLLAGLNRRRPGASIPLSLALSIQCAGATVMMAGYIKGGAAALPLTATLVATAVPAWLISNRIGGSAGLESSALIGVGVVGLFGILFVGHFFGRISAVTALTMLLAPLLCWTTETRLLKARSPWIVGSVRLAMVMIPLLVVLVLAKRDFDRDMSPLL